MKKRFLIGAAVGAAVIGLAGCGGGGGVSEETTTAETTETETTTESTTATTTTAEATTESGTTTAEETTESETAATESESSSQGETGKDYEITVKKAADGFESAGGLTYESAAAEYTYSVLNDVSSHAIESKLDDEASSLSDADVGRIGDVMYAAGKTDFGYNVTAYRYIGEGKTVSSYAGIQYLSEEAVTPETVAGLLSDDYISY